MMAAFAQIDDQIEILGSAGAKENRRPIRRYPRPVRGDEHVGGERIQVGLDHFCQAGRTVLLARLNHKFGIEAEAPARFQRRGHRAHVQRVLPFVISRAAPVHPVAALRQRPGIEPFVPLIGITQDDIAMAVTEHRRQGRVLNPLGQQDRSAARNWVVEDRAAVAHRLESGCDFLVEIAP